MAQEITLPVKVYIENLQTILKDMRGQLGNLKVNSDSYKKIQAIIVDIEKKIQSLQVASSRPLIDTKQFTDLDKSVSKIEDDLVKIQLEASKIKFGDLQLSSAQEDRLKEFQRQIQEIEQALKSVKETAKNSFLESDIGKLWQESHPEALSQSLAQVTTAIANEVKKQKAELDKAKAQYEDYQRTLTVSRNLNGFMKKNHELTEATMGAELYNQIFNTKGNFKSGGRSLLEEWLQEQFNLDPAVIHSLTEGTGSQVRAAFSEVKGSVEQTLKDERAKASAAAKEQKTSTRNGATLTQAITERSVSFEQAAATQKAIVDANKSVETSDASLRASMASVREELESWKAGVTSAAQNNEKLGASCNSASGQLNKLHTAIDAGKQKLASLDQAANKLQGVSNFINRYVGIYAIVRRVTTAIKNAFNTIKELDKTITGIAVVTNMSQKDLWGKIGEYTSMAQQYGVATKDVYSVSQIFYQQGLQTSQVMSMTTESLKMAKIAGIDYTTAANAMTVAVRAFKMEMSEAQQVTDTYSALAAKFAVSSSEIANAMEKTASSAASVGMTLQSTSAFISVMEQTTRESAQNIGSALKSIISRYGEMKASPAKLLNVDGEEVSFNKVDTALKSVGISIKDASGQFRNFDDVIMELAAKWDSLDNNTQRYIATIMAGNRQQSRFIALVSNYDELSRAISTANDAENASIVQVAKTMDSLETKSQQLKNAFSQIYLDLHAEEGLKNMYDWLTRILKTIGKLGVIKGVLPTLMNIIGFGTGTKSLINMGKNALTAQRNKLDLDVTEAESKLKKVREEAERPIETPWTLRVDEGQLEAAKTRVNLLNDTTFMNQATTVAASLGTTAGGLALGSDQARLAHVMNAAQSGQFSTEAGIKDYLTNQMNVTPDMPAFNSLYTQLESLGQAATNAATGLDNTANSANDAATANENEAGSSERDAQAKDQEATSSNNVTTAKNSETTSSLSVVSAKVDEAYAALETANAEQQTAQEAYNAALADQKKAQDAVNAGNSDQEAALRVADAKLQEATETLNSANVKQAEAQAAYDSATADEEEAYASRDAANADNEEANGSRNTTGTGTGTGPKYNSTLMKGIGVASGLARIGGTALTAIGAATQDKSTDKREYSKIYTGLGNGLSMAGTGASMGMAFGPWGAAIGGVLGFLAGGIGSIIDGLKVTAAEKLAMLQEEAKKDEEESLKQSAKSTGLKTSIENLQTLQKAMYNSTDDMKAYKDAMNNMASEYPGLVSAYDEAGNAIIDLQAAEEYLITVRQQAAAAARQAAISNSEATQQQLNMALEFQNKIQEEMNKTTGGRQTSNSFWGQTYEYNEGWDVVGPDNETITIEGFHRDTTQTGSYTTSQGYNYKKVIEETVAATKATDFEFTSEFVADEERRNRLNNILTQEREGNHTWTYQDVEDWAWWLSQDSAVWKGLGWNGWTAKYSPTGGGTYETTNSDYDSMRSQYNAFMNMGNFYNDLVQGSGELEFLGAVDTLNDFVTTNKELLGTSANSAAEYFGWDSDAPTREEVRTALQIMDGTIKQLTATKKSLETQTGKAYATEFLTNNITAREDMSSSTKVRLTDKDIYSSMVYRNLEIEAKEKGYDSSADWALKNKTEFRNRALLVSDMVASQFADMTETQLDAFEAATSDLTVYRNSDELLKKLGIDKDSEIGQALIQEFIAANEQNKKRILTTIYETDTNGNRIGGLNSDLKGLKQFDYETQRYNGSQLETVTRNKALDIADLFSSNKIISKYADYFTSQLVSINKLAEDGYTELAGKRLDSLYELSNQLAMIDDTQVQNDLFSTVTSIDFSSYSSITSAYKAIEQYGKTNHKEAEVAPLLLKLQQAEENLIYNVNTLSQELTATITSAAKEIDSILSTNKSGLSLDKAIEQFDSLKASFDNIHNFDEVFKYDAVLGKYVYTAEGLQKAIAQKEQELANQAEELSDTAEIYTKEIATFATTHTGENAVSSIVEQNLARFNKLKSGKRKRNVVANTREEFEKYIADYLGFDINDPSVKAILDEMETAGKGFSTAELERKYTQAHEGGKFASADEIMDTIKSYNVDEALLPYYQDLATGYMKSSKYINGTWDEFMAYIQEEVENNRISAEAAEQLYNEYKANEANQYYQQIDWSKIALNTDTSGSNKAYMEFLRQAVNSRMKEGEELLGEDATWEQILDAYLKQTYTDEKGVLDEAGYNAAKASIKGNILSSRSSQISSAISEVLNGTGQVLSDTTLALINEFNADTVYSEENSITVASGQLQSAQQSYIESAISMFDKFANEFTTLAERNNAYLSIIQKSFEANTNYISTLSSGASMDFSSLSSTFTSFGMKLDDFYSPLVGWLEDFDGVLETDQFGKTHIEDWSKFTQLLAEKSKMDFSALASTYEYKNAYSSYVDGMITLDTQSQELIKKSYDNAFSSLTAWKPINVSSFQNNKTVKDILTKNGAAVIEDGQLVIQNAVEYANNVTEYFATLSSLSDKDLYYTTGGWTKADLAKNWKNAQTVITAVQDTWTDISENISSLSVDNISTLAEKGNFNLKNLDNEQIFTKIGDKYALTLEAYQGLLVHYIGGEGATYDTLDPAAKKKVDDAVHKASAAIVNKVNGLDWTKIIDGTATAAETDEFLTGLEESLASLGTSIAGFYKEDGSLDYDALVADLKQQVNMGELDAEIAEGIINNIQNTVAAVRDTAFDEISSGMTLLTGGTNSQAEMVKFLQRYNKLTNGDASLDDIFQYNELTQSYTLTADALKTYNEQQKTILKGLGMTDEAVSQYIKDQAQQNIGAEMDITGFLSSTDISANGKAAKTLMQQIKNWYAAQSETLTDVELDAIMQTLVKGGDEAVKKLKEFKGESNVSSDEIESVYKAQVNRLNDAIDSLEDGLQKGAIITGALADTLKQIGYSSSLTELGDGTYVVKSAIDMIDAYAALYIKMKNTAEATTAEINNVYAKLVTATEQSEMDAISTLGDAMGMDYSALGEVLAKYGKGAWSSLEFALEHQMALGIQQIGNGKVKIVDFKKFASWMNWDYNSEEYIQALKEYNDSLIEDATKVADEVTEELKGLTEAKTGQKVNITRLQRTLKLTDEAFNALFSKYNVTVKDGVLTILDHADIPGLTSALTATVAQAADLIPEQVAEIKDAVVEALKAIAELIQNGISGSLSNVDAVNLQGWANEHGLGKLDFHDTTEGLKLSEKSAIALYNKMKEIDGLQGQIVFDELKESLIESNENYKTMSANMERIAELNEKISDPNVSSKRREEYEAELKVAKEILAVRSTSEDSSFDFMNNDIPAAQNNPITYFESWGTAWKTLRDSFKTSGADKGKIEYQDFYNIITEMGHIAEVSGTPIKLGAETFVSDAESAAELIEKGAGCLTTATDGSVKVDLSKFGMDFSGGAEDMKNNVDTGIQAIAKSQIEMIDSMIKLLEVVVAMEALGDIDVNGDNHLNLDEIFQVDGDTGEVIRNAEGLQLFTEKYSEIADNILKLATTDEDLNAALEAVRINGYTMKEIFEDAIDGVNNLGIDAQEYQQAIDAFYQMAISGDYDLDNIADSIQKIMASSGMKEVSVDVGEKTFYLTGGNKFVFDWSDEKATKAAEDAITSYGEEFAKKFNLTDKPGIKEKLLTLASKLEDPNLSIEEKSELQYVLQLGTGAIKIEEVEGKKGEYTGTYKGKHVTGSKEDVEKAIQEAIRYEEEGFEFVFEDDGSVTGKLTIAGAVINIEKQDDGTIKYKTPWNENGFDKKEDAIRDCVEHGYADSSMDGYTYDGGNIEVQYNSGLNIGYTINHTTGKFTYKDKTFASKGALIDYVRNIENMVADSSWTKTTNADIVVYTKGNATVEHNIAEGTITYTADGHTFASGKEFAEYMAARDLSSSQNGEDNVIQADGSVNYKLLGREVSLTVDAEGHLHYEFTVGGLTYTADSEEGIKQAMADHDFLHGGDAKPAQSKEVSYTVKEGNNASITVTYGAKGVTVTGGNDETTRTEMQKKLNEHAQSQADQVTPQATVDKVEIALSSDGKMVLANDVALKVSDTLEKVDADVTELAVNPASITVDTTQIQTVAETIATKLQEELDKHPLTPKFGAGQEGDNQDSGGGNTDTSGLSNITSAFDTINTAATTAATTLDTVSKALTDMNATNMTTVKDAVDNIDTEKVKAIQTEQNKIKADKVTAIQTEQMKITTEKISAVSDALSQIDPSGAQTAKGAINGITVPSRTGNITFKYKTKKADAKGNVALAKGTGSAMSGGTLMGELGPELVVSHGRYFLVGQNGAEFVNLANDAIVFNHLQTQRLISNGNISSRGEPYTNEVNAVSYAKGNVTGPAKADGDEETKVKKEVIDSVWVGIPYTQQETFSPTFNWGGSASAKGNVSGLALASASSALAALKQLKAMWESLASASVSDLAGKAGGGGGGGSSSDFKAYVDEVERWYNLLQEIAQLEEDITYEEKKRSRISSDLNKSGHDYYTSLTKSWEDITAQIKAETELQQSQQSYFDKRRESLNNSSFSRFYTFDENGQLKYKDGAFEELAGLKETDEYGNPRMSAQEQYESILSMNPDFAEYMKYDSSGNEIKLTDDDGNADPSGYASAVQAFWDKMDSDKEEMQSLHDSIQDAAQKQEELMAQRNEILNELKDNQKDVEQKIYDTIVDIRQRAIDELQDTRDAIEESNSKLIDGLNNALTKEQNLYNTNEDISDLQKKRNQLAILQRTGGSATEISSLIDEISDLERENYFTEQQNQIDAIQEASDKEIEKLDAQIDLMTDTLDYEKKYGLLWDEVTEIMQGSPEDIANYIADNNSEYWNQSPISREDTMKDLLFSTERWTDFRDQGLSQLQASLDDIKASVTGDSSSSGNPSSGDDGSSGSSPVNSGGEKAGQWKQGSDGRWWYQHTSDGSYTKSGWETIDGKKYYFDDEGWMKTGWVKDNGKWYYLNTDGTIKEGWLQDNNKWYYLGEGGEMVTGKQTIDGKEYEFDSEGAMIEDTKKYASGGLANYTGLAWLDGTKSKPEAVLNAEQTRFLREDLLGKKKNSLSSILGAVQDSISNTANSNTYNNMNHNSGGVTFDGMSVNMNFNEVSNDYDAQRAGDQAMNEMLRIARKTAVNALGR